jgi:hypothetical protein
MGVDLFGRNGPSFQWAAWRHLLTIAKEFGWQPTGTEAPPDIAEWQGTYFSNDFQEVTKTDAAAMGAALFRASAAMRSGKLTEREAELLEGTNLSMIEELAAYAVGGHFFIG